MRDDASSLVLEMAADVDAWVLGDEIDLEGRYVARIQAVGAVPFLAEVFRRIGSSRLIRWLFGLLFVWRNFSYSDWKAVLYDLSADGNAVYYFIPFAGEYLGVDMLPVVRSDSAIHAAARLTAAEMYPTGGPRLGSDWARDQLAGYGVDQQAMIQRFAAEGAVVDGRS